MGFIKKNSTLLFVLGIILFFFVTRFYNILGLPIFTDEAIYVRWSQIASNDAAWRFISLTDGKQPMFVWIAMLLMKVIHDPLLAGRMVSVFAGFASMVGIFFLTNEIFKNSPSASLRARKIGLLAAFIYVLYPFALVYDRMALYDSLVAMFIIWSLYFEILLAKHVRLDLALILGMIIGAGMLTKTNANFALILLPFSLLLFNFEDIKSLSALLRTKRFWRWVLLALVVAFIANIMYGILRLSPFFHVIGDKNLVFIYSFKEWIQQPFSFFWNNLRAMLNWLTIYSTLPFLLLVIAAFLVKKKDFKEKLLLLIWFIVPFLALGFFGKTLYPRFILFMTMPLLVLGVYGFYQLQSFSKKIWLKMLVFVVFFMMFVINGFYIITDFTKASVPESDRDQFYAGWPSGVGVKETVDFLQEKAKNEKIYVGTEGTFGLMPYALEIYLGTNPNVIIKGFWPINDVPPKELVEASKDMSTYVVFYQDCPSCPHVGIAPIAWPVKQVFQIEKAEGGRHYTLYHLEPK